MEDQLMQLGFAGGALAVIAYLGAMLIKERQSGAAQSRPPRHGIDPYQVIRDNAASQREMAEAISELTTWLRSREDADLRDRERMLHTLQQLTTATQGIVSMCKELLERVKELRR